MTLEDLNRYRKDSLFLLSEIKALEFQIEARYDTRRSPTGNDRGGHSGPGDTTGKAANDIIAMKEELSTLQTRWNEIAKIIDEWLKDVDDTEIRSIVRWHYALGLSWKRTSAKVYGRNDYYLARKRLYRFFGKE